MLQKDPHFIPVVRDVANLPLGKDLVLVLNLYGKAKIAPHIPEWSQTLTVMNNGPDENISLKRNGNFVVINQPDPRLIGKRSRPHVDIFLPHTFKHLTINLFGNAVVSGKAFPNATIIRAEDDTAANLETGDCFASLKDSACADITITPSERLVKGRYVEVLHDLVLVSWGETFKSNVNIMGEIGKAYMLIANERTGTNFAYVGERHIFTPRTSTLDDYMFQSRIARIARHKQLSPEGLQRKAAQMWRGFNACVRSKAVTRSSHP